MPLIFWGRIICGPIWGSLVVWGPFAVQFGDHFVVWGSFAVGDHLWRCADHVLTF